MPGLLDFLNSDDAALGLGLLAAGGPTSDPNASGFGARLAGAVQQAKTSRDAREDRDFKRKLMQSQIDENATQNALRLGQLERQRRQDEYYLGGAAGGATAPAPAAAAGAGAGSPMAPAAPAGPGSVPPGAVLKSAAGAPSDAPPPGQGKFAEWSQKYGIPVDALVSDYFSNGGKKIAEMLFERTKPDWQTQDGYTVNRNAPGFAGGFQPGLTTSANGTSTLRIPDPSAPGGVRIQAPQGALATAGAYAEQEARTRAANTPGRPTILPGGRMGGQSQLAEINGGAPAAPVLPGGPLGAPRGPTNAGERGMAASVAEPMGFDVASGRRELAATRNDLRTKQLDPASRQMLEAHAADLERAIAQAGTLAAPLIGPGAGRGVVNPALAATAAPTAAAPTQVQGGGLEFSPAEKAEQAAAQKIAEGRASAQVARETSAAATGRQFSQMTAAAEMADKLLTEGPTGSGVGALADRVGNFVGQPLKGASQAAQLKALGGWLVANVPRMEGPQSDRDVANYAVMAGQVGDETLPPAVRRDALRTVIALQTKYAAINGGQAPAGTSANAPNTTASGRWVPPSGWSVRER